MKFAVMSDSHGNVGNVCRLAFRLMEAGIQTFVHLGDDYDDPRQLFKEGLDILRVPGVYSDYYKEEIPANRLLLDIGGLRVLLTHAPEPHENDLPGDGDPKEIAAREKPDLVLYGHTHVPRIENRDGVLWVNPGHLKSFDKKGAPPSYALIDTDAEPFRVEILALDDDQVLIDQVIMETQPDEVP